MDFEGGLVIPARAFAAVLRAPVLTEPSLFDGGRLFALGEVYLERRKAERRLARRLREELASEEERPARMEELRAKLAGLAYPAA